jgi:CubicO group peptidase (beta-lactamase class C family)
MSLVALPPQPEGTPWPTLDWPTGMLPPTTNRAVLHRLLTDAFGTKTSETLGETHALVIIKDGRLILERYAEGKNHETTFPSWSKAKSITHALTGMVVGDGKLDIFAPANVPEWQQDANDPRRAITLDHLLRMSSGLAFEENYVPGGTSDVIEMLFGKGQGDVAAYAAQSQLAHPPGTFMSYSSGTTNIVSRILAEAAGLNGPTLEAFMRNRLFRPLGMKTATPKFDDAGNFIASSFCFASARDFARFGLLYLRDGIWDGRRLLPEGWVDYARTPTYQQPNCPDKPYGAHWWLGMAGPGSFSANGYEGQFTLLVPDLDMIVVRHGATPLDLKDNLPVWMKAIVDCFR